MKHCPCWILVGLLLLDQNATAGPAERVIVVGEARSTAEVPYTRDLSASKAIIAAGGWSELSHKSIYLVRSGRVAEIDMRAVIEKGERDKDVPLKPWDIIAVGDTVRQHR